MNIYATLANSTVTERWPGLYMADDVVASKAEYDYLVEQKEFISKTIMSEVIKFDYIYTLLTDEDTRLRMMDRVASDYIYPFSAVLEAVENDGFKNDIKTATNAAANSLYSYFVDENPELIDPFAWEDL
jgi:DNA polymerase I-like protein with 3'-5' exonuclease and polymerase domains